MIDLERDELKDRGKEYIEKIASTLPITAKIIPNAGNDVEKASQTIIIELFNWIGKYAEIPKEFLTGLEKIVSKENVIRVFHYGEPSSFKYFYFSVDACVCLGQNFSVRRKVEKLKAMP